MPIRNLRVLIAFSVESGRIERFARAAHWYRKTVSKLTALQKTLVEKRLKEISATSTK